MKSGGKRTKDNYASALAVMREIAEMLNKAEDLFLALPDEIQYAVRIYHSDHASVPAYLRWGAQNSGEIVEEWNKVIGGVEK